MLQGYLILNEYNIAESYSKQTKLINKPENYIEVENEDMLWHKYENGQWSIEKFEPSSTAPIDEFTQLKIENEQTKQALAELTMYISTMNGGI